MLEEIKKMAMDPKYNAEIRQIAFSIILTLENGNLCYSKLWELSKFVSQLRVLF